MSWDHWEYPAVCRDCGKAGHNTFSMNDWFKTKVSWTGFDFVEVRTKRDHTGHVYCQKCGSSSIEVGTVEMK